MKKLKKMFAVMLTVAMTLAMGMTTFAADITIKDGAAGSEYAAFKLLNATDGGDGKYAYTLNDTYADVLKAVTGKTAERDIVAAVSNLKQAEEVRAFADAVFKGITEKGIPADATTSEDSFKGLAQGYYLIAETKTGDEADTYSLVMLDTAGNDNITVTPKEDKPELTKKVQEKNDTAGSVSDWQDAADYDINDTVAFQLTGTVVQNYDNYAKYAYKFHDKMSAGLTFNANSVEVSVDGAVMDASLYTVVTEGFSDGCTFEVVFNDLKQAAAVKAGSKITVDYTAVLNSNAVIGSAGNPNASSLEYSNNPYGDGTGKTPEDKVTVFTYQLITNKVDADHNALNGAGFTLYKYDAAARQYVAVGKEITGVTTFNFKGIDAGQYKLSETTVPDGYNKADDFEFVVEATYDTESDAPSLLTLLIKDMSGKLLSDPDDKDAIFTADADAGFITTDVVNNSGTELPATGGIGTKIFYTIGAILMIFAGVLLITRRRALKK